MFGHPFGYAKFVTLISAICMHESKSGPGWEPQFVSISPLHPQQNACSDLATDADTVLQIQLQQIWIQLLRSSNAAAMAMATATADRSQLDRMPNSNMCIFI